MYSGQYMVVNGKPFNRFPKVLGDFGSLPLKCYVLQICRSQIHRIQNVYKGTLCRRGMSNNEELIREALILLGDLAKTASDKKKVNDIIDLCDNPNDWWVFRFALANQ